KQSAIPLIGFLNLQSPGAFAYLVAAFLLLCCLPADVSRNAGGYAPSPLSAGRVFHPALPDARASPFSLLPAAPPSWPLGAAPVSRSRPGGARRSLNAVKLRIDCRCR